MFAVTRDELSQRLAPRHLQQGERFRRQGWVRGLHVDNAEQRVSGQVANADGEVYDVAVELARGRDGLADIRGHCSCPLGGDCSHVAAVLLAASEHSAAGHAANHLTASQGQAWQRWLERTQRAFHDEQAQHTADTRQRLIYLLDRESRAGGVATVVHTVTVRPDNGRRDSERYNPSKALANEPPRFLSRRDIEVLRVLALDPAVRGATAGEARLQGPQAGELIESMLITGRCHWRSVDGPRLAPGRARGGTWGWVSDGDDGQRLSCRVDGENTVVLPATPPWYVDPEEAVAGPVVTDLPEELAETLLRQPHLSPDELADVDERLHGLAGRQLPRHTRLQECTPVAHLRLMRLELAAPYGGYAPYWASDLSIPAVHLTFSYDGHHVDYGAAGDQVSRLSGDTLVYIQRDAETEHAVADALRRHGLAPLTEVWPDELANGHEADWSFEGLDIDERWTEWALETVPQLREQGWEIEIDADFPYQPAGDPRRWYAAVTPTDHYRFRLELGVEIDGERVNMLPALARVARGGTGDVISRREDGSWVMALPGGELLPLPGERLRGLVDNLVELHDASPLTEAGELELPRLRAPVLTQIEEVIGGARLAWDGGAALRRLGRRLRQAGRLRPVDPPAGLRAELRPYQQSGLNWLQFLGQHGVGGILADDMGLGKTIQTLAHILRDKEQGRLDAPALIVVPTSLVSNWCTEAKRFAPELSVLALRGPNRAQHFDRIPASDVIVTTYALLPRDHDTLKAQRYHLVVLDEAQHIKNPRSKAGQLIRTLEADHRLCLTGTPLENHLGELWALMDVVVPGLMGNEREFQSWFREPIERQGDAARQQVLARRVSPFLLRRTKEDVAAELPEKIEVTHTMPLAASQRRLYEDVRRGAKRSLDDDVARLGIARSQIAVLDALLRLRQVCCDPRLVDSAHRDVASSKLDHLMELVTELVDEGRRLLVFSQFTSMLALIEEALGEAGLSYCKLTGQTRDRDAQIQRFQNGEAPVFLISLKAGGTGLNLTAADTVIHYDPWWNPAVQNQATDRAHRIGQDKTVFVYKLVTEGTVEERILALQARKQALADDLYNEAGGGGQIDTHELAELLKPLE